MASVFNGNVIIVLKDSLVLQISCGNNHSILLDSAHNVYLWGLNNHRQVCTKETHVVVYPVKLQLNGVYNVYGFWDCSFFQSKDGVFCIGERAFPSVTPVKQDESTIDEACFRKFHRTCRPWVKLKHWECMNDVSVVK